MEIPPEVQARYVLEPQVNDLSQDLRCFGRQYASNVKNFDTRDPVRAEVGIDAFRVDCKSSLDVQDSYWVSPKVHPFLMTKSVRGPKNPAGPGTQETALLRLPS